MENLILYHGSRALFERFDYSYIGSQPGSGSSRLGIGMYWMSKKEKVLNSYANMSENISEDSFFRGSTSKCRVVYQTQISNEEQKKILDLLFVSDDILKRLEKLADQKTKIEIQTMLKQKKRYPDFAIWARGHLDLIIKSGFNCLKEKDIFCFLEPEKLKWKILKAKVLPGTKIPSSLIAEDTKIIIQNKLLSSKTSSSVRTKTVLGKDLLSQTKSEKNYVTVPHISLKTQLKQMMKAFLKQKSYSNQNNYLSFQKKEGR